MRPDKSFDALAARAVESKEIDGVRYASQFDGADGGEMIQSAVGDLPGTGGRVVVGPEGPDTGRDVTDAAGVYVDSGDQYEIPATAPVWLLDAAVELPSNVTVELRDATLVLQDGSDQQFFRNARANDGTGERDENVAIVGAGSPALHGNAANQASTSDIPEQNGIHFHKVDGFRLGGFELVATEGWGIVPEDVNQAHAAAAGRIDDVVLCQDPRGSNPDGIHPNGPLRNLLVTNVRGIVSDDAFAPSTVGGRMYGRGGPVRNVVIDGFEVYTNDVGDCLKLVGGDHAYENVVLANGYYESLDGSQPILSIAQASGAQNPPGPADLRNVTVANVTGAHVRGFEAANGGIRGVTLANVTVDPLAGSLVSNSSGYTVEDVDVVAPRVRESQQPPGVFDFGSGVTRNLSIRGGTVRASTYRDAAALALYGTVEGLTVDGLTVAGNTDGPMTAGVRVGSAASLARCDLAAMRIDDAGVDTLFDVGDTALRVGGVVGGGRLDGVDLGAVDGEVVGDLAVADGTTKTAGHFYRWDGNAWRVVA